jgi:hypothetical protein
MTRFVVTFSGRSVLRLPNEVTIGKAVVEPWEEGMQTMMFIDADSFDEAERAAGLWARALGDAIALVTFHSVDFSIKESFEIPEPGAETYGSRSHTPTIIRPFEIPVMENELLKAGELLEGVQAHGSDTDPWRRAMSWYVRGIKDQDPTDKFLDHWISLETLSKLYVGPVEPVKCRKCGEITNMRPDARVVMAFLQDLKVDVPANLVKLLTGIRGPLFHDARAMKEAGTIQPLLRGVLRECLVKTLERQQVAEASPN